MTEKKLKEFKNLISQHRDALQELLNNDQTSAQVCLTGSTVSDVLQVIGEFGDALERINSGSFGKCTECDGSVETERLEHDITTCVCLDHYTESQLRTLEKDLELTAKVQQDLLPCCAPENPELDIAIHARPAQVVGGDYYDFIEHPDGRVLLAIADVMGKGLPAGILMANLQATLRLLSQEYDHLAELSARINKLFRYNVKLIRFISLGLVEIDIQKRIINWCNAGHHPPLLWSAKTQQIKSLDPTGPAIGLMHDGGYTAGQLTFDEGDLLFLYTDGLSEARNEVNEEFGEDRIKAYLQQHSQLGAAEFLDGLRDEAESFAGQFDDDMTMMAIRHIPNDSEESLD